MKNRLRITASIALAALAALSSCNDSYPGLNYDYGGDKITNNETYDKTPIMVFVNKQNFFSVSATRSGVPGRGTGPFTEENIGTDKYTNARFYIYAFRKETYRTNLDPGLTKEPDLTYTRLSTGGPEDEYALNCLVDGKEYGYGMPAKLTDDRVGSFDLLYKKDTEGGEPEDTVAGSGDYDSDEQLYYSYKYQNVGYNFFTYYIDNLKGEENSRDYIVPNRTADAVSYNITIDGTQDIMCGSAPDLTASMFGEGESKPYNFNLTKEERDVIIGQGGGGYSTFAAHRGVYPIVDMKHQLAMLNFKAYPGDERCKDITITAIKVKAPKKGTLTVAARKKEEIGFVPDTDSEGFFELTEESENGAECENLKPIQMAWPYDDKDNKAPDIYADREETKIGGAMMLPQQGSYQVELHFTQMKRDGDGNYTESQPLVATYTIEAPTADEAGEKMFRKGYRYNIYIVVYGLQPIKMAASIEGWHAADTLVVDPDDPKYDNNPDDPNDEGNLWVDKVIRKTGTNVSANQDGLQNQDRSIYAVERKRKMKSKEKSIKL